MGKAVDEQDLNAAPASPEPAPENAGRSCPQWRSVGRFVSLRCVAALLFGVALLLPAVFWLPPFFLHNSNSGDLDHDPLYGADVVASFRLQKPLSSMKTNVAKLQYDIFNEIGVPNTTIAVIYLNPLGINSTDVVFGMWPYPKNSNISIGLSILKSSLVSLILRQSTLHLTMPLFGSSYFFQVLKFPGGITVVPPQTAFLLQEEHTLFNFTLNFPICQVQEKVAELKDQMKLGLHLKSYEILFVKLTNTKGSTLEPPIVVGTSIVLAVGNIQPSVPRLKQLAQNIRNSSAGNLGLNHTVFGRVKQIRLSSFLQHSLSSRLGSSLSPSPAPQPNIDSHLHHRSNRHHHWHHSDVYAAPAPSLKPIITHLAPAPSGCRFEFSTNPKRKPQIVPIAGPVSSHHSSAPLSNEIAPTPTPHLHPKSNIPATVFVPARPPSEHIVSSKPEDEVPSVSPSLSSSFVEGLTKTHWVFVLLFAHFVIPLQLAVG